MLELNHEYTPGDHEVQKILRHTFLKDETSMEGAVILLRMLGTFSSEPDLGPGKAHLRALGMQLLEDLGINHRARERDMVFALLKIPPVTAEPEEKRSTE